MNLTNDLTGMLSYLITPRMIQLIIELVTEVITCINQKKLDALWGRNCAKTRPNEFGAVTLESAGYVARYAAKKLVHGRDQDHDYHPYHKTSSRRAIGRNWIEKNYRHTFENGYINLPTGVASIPRYYLDWCAKYQPELFYYYISEVRPAKAAWAEEIQRREEAEYLEAIQNRRQNGSWAEPEKKSKVKETILKNKFKRLQERLKL